MKKLLLSVSFLVFCGSISFGQITQQGFSNNEVFEWQIAAQSDTYEFQHTTKGELAYSVEFMEKVCRQIELERRENEDIYVVYSDYLTIYIPSKSKISDK